MAIDYILDKIPIMEDKFIKSAQNGNKSTLVFSYCLKHYNSSDLLYMSAYNGSIDLPTHFKLNTHLNTQPWTIKVNICNHYISEFKHNDINIYPETINLTVNLLMDHVGKKFRKYGLKGNIKNSELKVVWD